MSHKTELCAFCKHEGKDLCRLVNAPRSLARITGLPDDDDVMRYRGCSRAVCPTCRVEPRLSALIKAAKQHGSWSKALRNTNQPHRPTPDERRLLDDGFTVVRALDDGTCDAVLAALDAAGEPEWRPTFNENAQQHSTGRRLAMLPEDHPAIKQMKRRLLQAVRKALPSWAAFEDKEWRRLQTFKGAKAQHVHYDFDPRLCLMLDPREVPLSAVVSLGTARLRFWPLDRVERVCVCEEHGGRCEDPEGGQVVQIGKGEAIVFLGHSPHGGTASSVDTMPRVHVHLMTVQDVAKMPVNESYPC